MFQKFLCDKAEAAGYSISSEKLTQFQVYFEQVIETNKQFNLTNITQPEDVAIKHMIDSLTVYDTQYFPAGATVCDVGSGAGFPGIPLKIMYADLKIVLLDSLTKRVAFLNDTIKTLGLQDIHAVHLRAEDAGRSKEHRGRYDVVVARAVAPLNVLAEYCLPLAKPGGMFASMKGRQTTEEICAAKNALCLLRGEITKIKRVNLPTLPDERNIVYIQKIANTPASYPRQAGKPEKQPLV